MVQRFELVYESLRRFKTLMAVTERADPYKLKSIGQVSFSDTHLKAAYWKPFRQVSPAAAVLVLLELESRASWVSLT